MAAPTVAAVSRSGTFAYVVAFQAMGFPYESNTCSSGKGMKYKGSLVMHVPGNLE
jgi:hypothetical protein